MQTIIHRKRIVSIAIGLSLTVGAGVYADLAAESEAYCKSTASETPTPPEAIIAKVDQAAALLEKEGQAAFPKFQGEGSEYIFDGTYIWIHSLSDCTMMMHPIKTKMVGKQWAGLKDKNGKFLFAVMNAQCSAKGSAWVEYYWPKPGTSEYTRKISYVKTCTLPDGTEVVIGCGLYNYTDESIASLTIN